MGRTTTIKQGFSYGMIDEAYAERLSVENYRQATKKLSNVIIQPTEGVRRRDGFQFVDTLKGEARLIPIDNDNKIIMGISETSLDFYKDGKKIHTPIFTEYPSKEGLAQMNHTQLGNEVFVCCQDLPPLWIKFEYDDFNQRYIFIVNRMFFGGYSTNPAPKFNFQNFVPKNSSLRLTKTPHPRKRGAFVVTLTKENILAIPAFNNAVENARSLRIHLRINGHTARIFNINSGISATILTDVGDPIGAIENNSLISDWGEQSFSYARGWPRHCVFHKNRFILAGTKIFPNDIWISRINVFNDFDSQDTKDDAPIHLRLNSTNDYGIHHIESRDALYVFSGDEIWCIDGDPFAPLSISATRVGKFTSSKYKGFSLNTINHKAFSSDQYGKKLWVTEFKKTSPLAEKIDLSQSAPEILDHPKSFAFNPSESQLFMVNDSGSIAAMLYRSTPAWVVFNTQGSFNHIAMVGNDLYAIINRSGRWAIEMMASDMLVDSAVTLSSTTKKTLWADPKLKIFEAQNVYVIFEDGHFEIVSVANQSLRISRPAKKLQIGYGFTHEIEPLPMRTFHTLPELSAIVPKAIRPLQFRLLLKNTAHCRIDIGNQFNIVPLQSWNDPSKGAFGQFSGEKILNGLGWVRDSATPLWRICQKEPGKFSLLSIWTEIRTSN